MIHSVDNRFGVNSTFEVHNDNKQCPGYKQSLYEPQLK